ncbi:MAG: YncE family protein [Gracilimonas sp.]|uniref:YncE family protein n=1 Tax=Gracilimonas sp. TaxID=1974203 RepID=UPI0019A80BBD|nr:YncE family protein [Gracilimonas sp.]MBD3616599.1 YncE family protein [Gracilimonas sp.]
MYFIKSLLTLVLFCALAFTDSVFAQDYYVYVAAESDDQVQLIHFNAETGEAAVSETIDVGVWPQENEGPHGLTISSDGKYWFVTIAHGTPYGQLWKYETGTNKFIAKVELGMFPASMDYNPLTGLVYVVNFNLHGDMKPSTLSVVDSETMMRLADIPVGIMPHGTRISPEGDVAYHVSMMTDELYEIDAYQLEVKRTLSLGQDSPQMDHFQKEAMDHSNMNHSPVEKPTWADPHPSKPFVYIAGNGSNEIIEVDTKKWEITRRFNTAKGPYNLEVSHNGKLLVVSYKGEGAVGIWDLEKGEELAYIENSRKVTHGVAITPDNKFAFISVEGIGGEPGSVDIIDLKKLERVDVVETGKQAGGIVFWKQK